MLGIWCWPYLYKPIGSVSLGVNTVMTTFNSHDLFLDTQFRLSWHGRPGLLFPICLDANGTQGLQADTTGKSASYCAIIVPIVAFIFGGLYIILASASVTHWDIPPQPQRWVYCKVNQSLCFHLQFYKKFQLEAEILCVLNIMNIIGISWKHRVYNILFLIALWLNRHIFPMYPS